MARVIRLAGTIAVCAALLAAANARAVALIPQGVSNPTSGGGEALETRVIPPSDKRMSALQPSDNEHYVLLSPAQKSMDKAKGMTLVIVYHGSGDTPEHFATVWEPLVHWRNDVLVALPTEGVWDDIDTIRHIIQETVARDGVNPKHVFLAGYSGGGGSVTTLVFSNPSDFAGFGVISAGFDFRFMNASLKAKAPKMAAFYSLGSGEGKNSKLEIATVTAMLRNFGFGHVQGNLRDGDHYISYQGFLELINEMMTCFDQSIADNDRAAKVAAMANPPADTSAEAPADVAIEQRTAQAQGTSKDYPSQYNYFLLAQKNPVNPPAGGRTLIIGLHGMGDTAAEFAQNWMALVKARGDVEVAVPPSYNNYSWDSSMKDTPELIRAIIADTVARDQVNPQHVFLVAHDEGNYLGIETLYQHPDWLAGYACLSSDFVLDPESYASISRPLRARAPHLAMYYAVGAKDQMHSDVFSPSVDMLKKQGFTNLLAESPDCGHAVAPIEIAHLMALFDQTLAKNRATDEIPEVITAERPLPKVKSAYVIITPNRQKYPTRAKTTLLVCLPDKGQTAADFAASWQELVKSRHDLAVAVPELAPSDAQGNGAVPAAVVESLIQDTVARDKVDNKHVILVGYGEGGQTSGRIFGSQPQLFWAYAGINTTFPQEFYCKAMQAKVVYQKVTVSRLRPGGKPDVSVQLRPTLPMPVYYAMGRQDEQFRDLFPKNGQALMAFGYINMRNKVFTAGHALLEEEIEDMMTYFDAEWAKKVKGPAQMLATR